MGIIKVAALVNTHTHDTAVKVEFNHKSVYTTSGFLEYSLEGLVLKLQYFGHLMQRANSLEKTLMLGKIEGRKRRGQQRMR